MLGMADWLDVIFRGVMMLVVIFFVTKILGKKQLSQLSFFEYTIGITVGSIGAEVITGLDRSFYHGIIGIVAFVAIPYGIDFLTMKSKKMRDFFAGKATVIIKNGNILEDSLRKEKYTIDELMELLRKKNVFQVSDVEFAILEPTGDLNILLKKEKQPLTAEDLQLTLSPEKEPSTIIMDGTVMNEMMESIGKNEEWLRAELHKKELVISDVFLAQLDSQGRLSLDLYDTRIEYNNHDHQEVITALLKRCEADLDLLSLSAQDEKGILLYKENSNKIKGVLHDFAHS